MANIVIKTIVAIETIMIYAFALIMMLEISIGTSSAITTTTVIKTRARRPIQALDGIKTFGSCDYSV
jgi:hypothetical protein